MESIRRGFLREGLRLLEEVGRMGLGLLGGGTEVDAAAAAAAAMEGALCKQIREANGCSNLTMNGARAHGVRVLRADIMGEVHESKISVYLKQPCSCTGWKNAKPVINDNNPFLCRPRGTGS